MIPKRLDRFARDFEHRDDRPKVSFWLPITTANPREVNPPVFTDPTNPKVLILRHMTKPGTGLFWAAKELHTQVAALSAHSGAVYNTVFHAPDATHPYALLECTEIHAVESTVAAR